MKAVVAAFNQEKALVGAFSVITNLRMELFEALLPGPGPRPGAGALPRVLAQPVRGSSLSSQPPLSAAAPTQPPAPAPPVSRILPRPLLPTTVHPILNIYYLHIYCKS